MKAKNKGNNQWRHDSLIDIVEKDLKDRGFKNIYKNTEYSNISCGEIDLWAKKDNYILIFEMKSSYSQRTRNKAIEQLNRAERNCFPLNRVFKFYVSNYKCPRIDWIKNEYLIK